MVIVNEHCPQIVSFLRIYWIDINVGDLCINLSEIVGVLNEKESVVVCSYWGIKTLELIR
jgi:hypothetical protein